MPLFHEKIFELLYLVCNNKKLSRDLLRAPFNLLGSGLSFQIIILSWKNPKKVGQSIFQKIKLVFCICQKITDYNLNLILFPYKFYKIFSISQMSCKWVVQKTTTLLLPSIPIFLQFFVYQIECDWFLFLFNGRAVKVDWLILDLR